MGQQLRRKTDLPEKAAVQGGSKQDRARNRFPFKGTCLLLPIASNGKLTKVAPINIVGRDLSTSGLSFSHNLPLSTKRAIVTIGRTKGERRLLEVDVVWSRRLSAGLYESGCRLVRNVTTPSNS